ncbi:Tetratricopeptide-like helical domain containing protein [Trema orientale]|uniref:Tetratricopeptide-like helical domain containing protein n=1 Tax=Trema orientale TaxID=63057 RepID=A0A2P5FI86_TREOI|nr:Tetratricopeptide-like helical domain containing protein [Trema orientale]
MVVVVVVGTPKPKGYFVLLLLRAACMSSTHGGTRAHVNAVSRVILNHCNTLKQLHQLHAHSLVTGLLSSSPSSSSQTHFLLTSFLFSATSLLQNNGGSGFGLGYAVSIFNLIQNPSTFSFNNIIRAHSLLSSPLQALLLFSRMRRLSLPPDFHTFPFALKASAHLGPTHAISAAQALHAQALKFAFAADSFVANALIRVYSLCCRLSDACRVFDENPERRDVVSYNTLIDAFVKAGEISRARNLFDEMPVRDSVSWGTILAGYAQRNHCDETIRLFYRMLESRVRPDNIALVSALSACAQLGDLERGCTVHDYIRTNGIRLDSFLTTGLVDLYAKCGCIEIAKEIFDSSSDKNLCTWNAMLVGFSMHGLGQLSLNYFTRMIEAGVKPDGVSFLGVLVGCSHAGLVDEARKLFNDMESVYMVSREQKHYGCMADLLGRAGLIEEAMEMIKRMPMGGDVFVWGGLLSGCRLHGNVEVAKKAAQRVMELKPEDGGVYSIMANVYANAEQWDDVVKMRRSRDSKRVKKNAGCSLIQLDGVTHEFVAGDILHPQTDEICSILNGMERHQFEAF